MIKCIIVDDEPHAIELLSSYIKKVDTLELVYSSTNPVEAFQYLQKNTVDLVFLDIHMPELDGIQFLKLLGGKSKVILTTAYPEHALEGYEHDVIDYLLKPIMFDRFLKAITKASELITNNGKETAYDSKMKHDDFILVKTETRGKLIKIILTEIIFIEGLGNYVAIHTTKDKTLCLITFKELETKLSSNHFIRVHKSFIISIANITMIEGNQIRLGAHAIPIGENYKAKLLEALGGKIINKK
jgi:two-component system, LytTR family, response regulator